MQFYFWGIIGGQFPNVDPRNRRSRSKDRCCYLIPPTLILPFGPIVRWLANQLASSIERTTAHILFTSTSNSTSYYLSRTSPGAQDRSEEGTVCTRPLVVLISPKLSRPGLQAAPVPGSANEQRRGLRRELCHPCCTLILTRQWQA